MSDGAGNTVSVADVDLTSGSVTFDKTSPAEATGVTASYTANAGDFSDVTVDWTDASDETDVVNYEVYVTQNTYSSVANLGSPLKTVSATSGADTAGALSGSTDSDGNSFASNTSYNVYVVTVDAAGNQSLQTTADTFTTN